jgi:hypothetical protein
MSKVWVIMENDFPSCVFDDKEKANRFIKQKKDEQAAKLNKNFAVMGPRVHWNSYEFEVK